MTPDGPARGCIRALTRAGPGWGLTRAGALRLGALRRLREALSDPAGHLLQR